MKLIRKIVYRAIDDMTPKDVLAFWDKNPDMARNYFLVLKMSRHNYEPNRGAYSAN